MNFTQTQLWIGFNLFVLIMLVLDLGVFHRKSKAISIRDALTWTAVWVAMALLFNTFVYYQFGSDDAFEFLTGYVIEKSLSVDNIFVIIIIFSYFHVPAEYQHKVLFWGILGALVMRVMFILTGIELIHKFHWLIYVFGFFLAFTGIRLLIQGEVKLNPEKNPVVRFVRRIFRVTPGYEGDQFFVRRNGLLWATPLFVVMVLIEATDLVFAVDSIPAILAISEDPFIVYTSNVFAILGLRSLYFAVAGIEKYFVYLKYALSAILIFIGIKMCLADVVKIPIEWSLIFIGSALTIAIVTSLTVKKRQEG
ncbi:TerC family protein [Chryseolinea sp. T2]|uniref:TerC family protein n=1 Tax=Chryseolinea sp. T2 TaxID=3129255 RepID=UPI003077BAAB